MRRKALWAPMLTALAAVVPAAVVALGVGPGPMAAAPAAATTAVSTTAPASAEERTTIVQLFQWPWKSVAAECENVLEPKGYGAVQISPPHEHIVLDRPGRDHEAYPWWQDYQPVSYPHPDAAGDWHKLTTRRGDAADFKDMIKRCHAAGVKIYADTIINHMTGADGGRGSAGTVFPDRHTYSGLYSDRDFNDCRRDIDGDKGDYQIREVVQGCRLAGLADLRTSSPYVQQQLGRYLKNLAALGVDGFRLDAAKHIPAGDVAAVLAQMREQITADPDFEGTRNPYIYQEVLWGADEAVHPSEYRGNGAVKDLQVSNHLSEKFWEASTRENGIHGLHAYPNGWGDRMEPGDGAVVMIDNHDSQRDALPKSAGGYSRKILTYKDGARYRLANVFLLGWDHGTPLVMSSFAFTSRNTSPPRHGDGTTEQVECDGTEWICEHRWSETADMVGFRNAVAGTRVNKTLPQPEQDWYSDYSEGDAGGKIAFSRGDKGYVVINRDPGSGWNRTYKTRLPAGTYCNVINGRYDPATRTCGNASNIIKVGADGTFTADVPAMSALAIHVGAIHDPGEAQPVDVTFTLSGEVPAGENAYVVGNVAQLGAGDTDKAVKLSETGDARSARVPALAPNTRVTYRYFTRNADGEITEDPFGDRTFQTPNSGTATRSDAWGEKPRGDVEVTHRLIATTVPGQDVYVAGNIPELGGWDPARAVRLTTGQDTYPQWSGSVTLKPGTAVEYKYIKKHGDQVVWEQGANRVFTVPAEGEVVRDDGTFRGDQGQKAVTGKYNIHAHTQLGQNLYVVGDIPELGGWDPARAVRLTTDQGSYPRWWGSASLPGGIRIEYKYLIRQDGRDTIWEQGGNRVVTTPANGEYVFDDGWFRR
ncbi:carbohydrate-binding module family 20 domain-containing protein [Planobispora siamensis]|uniref:Alpha-amylase n=1 Tax=Planobispora siamensis TaxID=936338 RepID=A0A8J3SQK5_9ACTN|nr:carbohydrate-binding module family 20 domain-containing protein [Planobispora siamensis]GIH97680.1 hypothetical protein Psi01_83100 [Planobispora siamensis]